MPNQFTFDPYKYDENLDQETMFIITINVPGFYLNFIHKLLKARRYPSRSEAIRVAIREFVHKEAKINPKIHNTKVEDLIKKINGTKTAVCVSTDESDPNQVEMHRIVKRLEY